MPTFMFVMSPNTSIKPFWQNCAGRDAVLLFLVMAKVQVLCKASVYSHWNDLIPFAVWDANSCPSQNQWCWAGDKNLLPTGRDGSPDSLFGLLVTLQCVGVGVPQHSQYCTVLCRWELDTTLTVVLAGVQQLLLTSFLSPGLCDGYLCHLDRMEKSPGKRISMRNCLR